MKLTYWVAECLTDSHAYSLRTKTRKECIALKAEQGTHNRYGHPHKVEVEYADAFDLLTQCLQEGSISESCDEDWKTE